MISLLYYTFINFNHHVMKEIITTFLCLVTFVAASTAQHAISLLIRATEKNSVTTI
jgi:hypothetical protein